MSLHLANSLYINTNSGERVIQLLIGDITALPVEQKVDVIFISAFPNDYSASPSSVIGSLKRQLNIDVKNLAYNEKAEDLRKSFHCWISKPLPAHQPYRQLLCFEQTHEHYYEVGFEEAVNDVFRAMMPIFNNDNKTVITPLLTAGDQRADKATVLKAMVTAAADWMRYGLPLQKLLVVVYDKFDGQSSTIAKETFEQLKLKIQRQKFLLKEPEIKLHIFLVHAKEDMDIAARIRLLLSKSKEKSSASAASAGDKTAQIVTVADINVQVSTWKYDVITAMMSSYYVVPLLTSAFLDDNSCLDQYNLALCANRRTGRKLLHPLRLDQLPGLPVYMCLLQWHDCIPRDSLKMQKTCETLIAQTKVQPKTKKKYDIFISYCHKNATKAKAVLARLRDDCPNASIFFDRDELKTGESWQESLYLALDCTKCVVALLSPEYFESKVCNEELNLALAQHLTTSRALELILLCIEPVENVSLFFHIQPLHAEHDIESVVSLMSKSIALWLETGDLDGTFKSANKTIDLSSVAQAWRKKELQQNYKITNDVVVYSQPSQPNVNEDNDCNVVSPHMSIYISYSIQDEKYAKLLSLILAQPHYNLTVSASSESEMCNTELIDSADCVIVLLSLHYQRSKSKIDEFNWVLYRNRILKMVYVIIVNDLESKPLYLRLVHCCTSLKDDFWADELLTLRDKKSQNGILFGKKIEESRKKIVDQLQGHVEDKDVLALMKAACDISVILWSREPVSALLRCQKGALMNVIDLYEESAPNSAYRCSPEQKEITNAPSLPRKTTIMPTEEENMNTDRPTSSPDKVSVVSGYEQPGADTSSRRTPRICVLL